MKTSLFNGWDGSPSRYPGPGSTKYDDFYVATKSAALARLAANYVVRFARRCDEVWAVSGAAARLIGDYGFPGPVRVMPNGVDIRSDGPMASGPAAGHFGLGDAPYLLYAGQLDWKKNLLLILRAAALLKNQGVSFNLVFAGRGNDREALELKAKVLGIADRLVLAGHLTDAAELDGLYRGASLFVFPSLYDTAGLVVREAAVMGTPSVLIGGSDAAEGISDGYNGYLCADAPLNLCRVMREARPSPAELNFLPQCAIFGNICFPSCVSQGGYGIINSGETAGFANVLKGSLHEDWGCQPWLRQEPGGYGGDAFAALP